MQDRLQHTDELLVNLRRCLLRGIQQRRLASANLRDRLQRLRPRAVLKLRRLAAGTAGERLRELGRLRLREKRARLEALAARLKLLGPEQVLARGYSITLHAPTGKVLRRADQVRAGDRLTTRLRQGEVESEVRPGPGTGPNQ